MAKPTAITLDTPWGLDLMIKNKNSRLKDATNGLSWLTEAYGMSYPVMWGEGKDIHPVMFTGEGTGEQEFSLAPTQELGNYCFWERRGEARGQYLGPSINLIREPVAIIFFFDFRDVYPSNYLTRTIENIKHEVVPILEYPTDGGRFQIQGFEARPMQVWNHYKFSDSGIFQHRNFGSLRVNIEAIYKSYKICE